MKTPVIFAALMAGSLAFPAIAAPENGHNQEIVVTGKSLAQTAADLAACLARVCSPDQDIAASLAHAENQFVAGSYKDARGTLLGAIHRNRKFGDAYPLPVSDLFRANGRVAEHVGEAKNFQLSVLDMRDTLRSAFGTDDAKVLVAQIEVGDSRAKLGFPKEAIRIYKDVEQQAAAADQPRIAGYAQLRQAILAQTFAEISKLPSDRQDARELLTSVVEKATPDSQDFALAAQVLLARLDRQDGRADSTQALIRQFAANGGAKRPVLLSANIIRPREDFTRGGINTDNANRVVVTGAGGDNTDTLNRLVARNQLSKWADIGFWVNANGNVTDVEILRSKGGSDWLQPVISHVNSRIYAPLKRDEEGVAPAFYLIERYSLTARLTEDGTATNMRRRENKPRIERLDLTTEDFQRPLIASRQ